MNTFKTQAWDSDIELALLLLKRPQIADHAYWYATVDIVEAGYNPDTNKPINLPALEAWVSRCKTTPPEEGNLDDTQSPPRTIHPSN
jgi:glutathione S-transferase